VATLFSDGFESGNFSAWDGFGGSTGITLEVTPAGAFHGVYGYRVSINGSAPAYAYASVLKSLGASYHELYCRFYFRVVSASNWCRDIELVLMGDFWSNGQVMCNKSGSQFRLYMQTLNDSGSWSTTGYGPVFSMGQSVCVEAYERMATGPGANDGILRLWQDGVLALEKTNIDNDTKPAANIFLLFNYNLVSPFAAVMEYDDVAVATARIEPVRGFRIYDNGGVGPTDYDTAKATVSEYVLSWMSGALSYPASYRFGVRAYNEYGEEKNVDVVEEVTLVGSGSECPARPNRPTSLAAAPAAGGKVQLSFSYDSTGEAAGCTHFHVYSDAGSGEVNYGTAIGTVTKDDGPLTHYEFLTGTLTSGVSYRFAVRAATASDAEDDGIESVAVTADADAPEQPASLSATVVR
jgi:hypothetical protein